MARYFLKSDFDRLDELRKYIIDNLHDDLCTRRLSKQVGLSPSTLRRQFEDHFGISLAQYIYQWRMWKAKSLLSEREHTVSEIADMVGYKEVASFTRAFSKLFGFPPSRLQTA